MRHARPSLVAVLALALAACADSGGERVDHVDEANTSVCPTAIVEGVDVSNGQGTIDWAKVAASGRGFAFMKATQGDYNTQTSFAANWAGSKAAGVLRSPYHFFDPTIDGVLQAQHFLSVLAAAGGLQPGDLPPMFDMECPTSPNQATAGKNCEYTGNSGWVATATLIQRAFDWLTTVEQATGRKPIIYSYPAWFAGEGFTDVRLAQYPLYIATLSTCASVPPPWTTTVFWQYSFTGTVPGIASQVDLDRFVGTKAQLIAFANGPVGDAGIDADAAPTHDAEADAIAAPDTSTLDAGDPNANAASGGDASGCSCDLARRTPLAPHAMILISLVLALVASRRFGPRAPDGA